MRRGEVSYSKVRALTRVATPETEEQLLEFALAGTAAHVEKLVRAWRRVDRFEAMELGEKHHEQRYLRAYTDEDGMVVVRARLAPEVGALFLKALEAAREALYQRSRESDVSDPVQVSGGQQRADALELLAESALEGALNPGTAGDRYQVVVHVSGEDVSAETSDREGAEALPYKGCHVSAETSRRLKCDSSQLVMTHDSEGGVLDVGRKTRSIHPALRRALQHRDGECRFPGCCQKRCDVHHVEHWADGGKTEIGNLLLLCRHHHRVLHEGGFRVELDADGTSRFYSRRGWLIPEVPPAPLLEGDPAVELTRRNWEVGLEINPSTGLPSWQGESLDLGYAIDGLWRSRRTGSESTEKLDN